MDGFNSQVKCVIDAIASTKVKVVSGRKRSPWRNASLVRIKKDCIGKLSAGGEKRTSRFTVVSINRDLDITIWNLALWN